MVSPLVPVVPPSDVLSTVARSTKPQMSTIKVSCSPKGSLAVWPDGEIIFQYLAIYSNENVQYGHKISQSRFKNRPNTK